MACIDRTLRKTHVRFARSYMPLFYSEMELVEAAGVEPASEKVYRKKTTCVPGSVVFVRPLRKPVRERRLSLIDFGFQAPDGSPSTYPVK